MMIKYYTDNKKLKYLKGFNGKNHNRHCSFFKQKSYFVRSLYSHFFLICWVSTYYYHTFMSEPLMSEPFFNASNKPL